MKNWKVSLWVLSAVLWAVPLQAQTVQTLNKEVESLREDLSVLQRQLYRERSDSSVPTATSSSIQVQLSQFEERVRDLVGRMDELEYKFKQVDERFKVMNQDIDVRFKMLEGKPITNSGLGTSAVTLKRYDAPVAKGAPKSIAGDSVTGEDLAPLPQVSKPEAKAAPAAQPEKKLSVNDIYQSGMNAFNAKNYAQAEKDFNQILKSYPKDKLAGNAQYWLGEIYFAKEDYTKAAVAFGKAYKNYKDGNKGADSIYKLGMSMQKLNKKTEACAAFKSLPSEFPKAEKALLAKAKKAAAGLNCK